jgi:hypothetical protein
LRPKIVWIMWFQLVILSIVALFTIIIWDRSSYMDLLMFYSLACLSFFRYRFHGFRSLSMYFPIDYYRFRNYRNIGAVFVSDNIVSISFSRKRCENESDLAFYRSFPIVFIPTIEACLLLTMCLVVQLGLYVRIVSWLLTAWCAYLGLRGA